MVIFAFLIILKLVLFYFCSNDFKFIFFIFGFDLIYLLILIIKKETFEGKVKKENAILDFIKDLYSDLDEEQNELNLKLAIENLPKQIKKIINISNIDNQIVYLEYLKTIFNCNFYDNFVDFYKNKQVSNNVILFDTLSMRNKINEINNLINIDYFYGFLKNYFLNILIFIFSFLIEKYLIVIDQKIFLIYLILIEFLFIIGNILNIFRAYNKDNLRL